jgi:hypothetical protein
MNTGGSAIDAQTKDWIRQQTIYQTNIQTYTDRSHRSLANIALALGTSRGWSTGGIASGPTSGHYELLHGTEAVIPLGDGNRITAHLKAPTNLIRQEAGDGPALRAALRELQAEVNMLRQSVEIGQAAAVGELKRHNARERKRDVVPQKVEIVE